MLDRPNVIQTCVAFFESSPDLDGGPAALAGPADPGPDPGGKAIGPDAAPDEAASFPSDKGGERC